MASSGKKTAAPLNASPPQGKAKRLRVDNGPPTTDEKSDGVRHPCALCGPQSRINAQWRRDGAPEGWQFPDVEAEGERGASGMRKVCKTLYRTSPVEWLHQLCADAVQLSQRAAQFKRTEWKQLELMKAWVSAVTPYPHLHCLPLSSCHSSPRPLLLSVVCCLSTEV